MPHLLPVATSCYQCYQLLPVATSVFFWLLPVASDGHKSPVFSFGCCYRSLQMDTSRQCFFFSSATSRYQSLPVATGGTQVDNVCFDSFFKSSPVAVVAFVFLSATGRYRSLQVDTSCCFCLSFTTCWMSLHANSCFVFINLLLFQGGSTPLNPH